MTRRARRSDLAPSEPVASTPVVEYAPITPRPAPPLAASRAALLAVGVLVAGTFVTIVGGPAAGVVIAGWLADGTVLAAWLLAAWAIGVAFVGNTHDTDDRTLRHLTAVALGLGAIGLLVFLLGWAGWLSRPVAWGIVAGGALAGILRLRARTAALNEWLVSPAGGAWLALVAVPAVAIAALAARVVPGFLWGDEPNGYDVVSYHLQLPREWFDLGRVVPLRHNVFSFMPLGVEMHALLAMHLRGTAHAPAMYLAQMMCGTFALLVPLACYAIVRAGVAGGPNLWGPESQPQQAGAAGESRHVSDAARRWPGAAAARRWPGAAAAALAASAPWTTMLGGIAYNEGGLMLYATLAAAHALRGRWAIAGACAGLAAGCKYTGVTSAILLVPVVVALFWRASLRDAAPGTFGAGGGRDCRPPLLRGAATFLGVALLVFSPWLIRNAIHAGGNPVFPLALRTLGAGHFDAGQVERFEVAHAPRDDQRSLAARAGALWRQVGADWRYAAVGGVPTLFAIALVAFALRPRDRAAQVWLGLIVGNVGVWLFATHLQGRFLVQAIPCAAILATVAPPRFGRAQAGATVLLALVAGAVAHVEPVRRLDPGLLRTVGLEDLRLLWGEDVRVAIDDRARGVTLVGDVRPFLLPTDSARLRYRTVFDIPSGATFHDAWIGPDVPDDAHAIVTPSEADRLARTYRHLPPLPARLRGVGGTFVVPAGELRRE